jgi:hypothetical protein
MSARKDQELTPPVPKDPTHQTLHSLWTDRKWVITTALAVTALLLGVVYNNIFLPIIDGRIDGRIDSKQKSLADKLDSVTNTINDDARKISNIEGQLKILLDKVITNPTRGSKEEVNANVSTARQILREAQQEKVVFEPKAVKAGAHNVFAHAVAAGPDVRPTLWAATNQYVSYQTFLYALTPDKTPGNLKTIDTPLPPGKSADTVIVTGDQELGGRVFMNARFEHARVTYGGGALSLSAASFYDCDFQISDVAAGRELAKQILDSPTVSIQTPAVPTGGSASKFWEGSFEVTEGGLINARYSVKCTMASDATSWCNDFPDSARIVDPAGKIIERGGASAGIHTISAIARTTGTYKIELFAGVPGPAMPNPIARLVSIKVQVNGSDVRISSPFPVPSP